LQFDQPVGDVMGFEVVSCHPEDDLARARNIMRASHKARIVVIDTAGRLQGVLSLFDVPQDNSTKTRGGPSDTMVHPVWSKNVTPCACETGR